MYRPDEDMSFEPFSSHRRPPNRTEELKPESEEEALTRAIQESLQEEERARVRLEEFDLVIQAIYDVNVLRDILADLPGVDPCDERFDVFRPS